MTLPTGHSGESSFVLHPFRAGAEGNQEEFESAQARMAQDVRALGEHRVRRPQEDQRELPANLTFGTRSAYLVAFSRLDQAQSLGRSIAGLDVEGLPHHVGEVLAREPLQFCHQAIVPACCYPARRVA